MADQNLRVPLFRPVATLYYSFQGCPFLFGMPGFHLGSHCFFRPSNDIMSKSLSCLGLGVLKELNKTLAGPSRALLEVNI